MAAPPEKLIRRQQRFDGFTIDVAVFDQGAAKQIVPEEAEMLDHGLAVEGADVAF